MLRSIKKLVKKEKGFTLVELLAVIAILAIILAIAVPAVGNVISDSETKAEQANAELFENAARLAHVSGVESASDEYSLKTLHDEGYLEEIPDVPGTDKPYDESKKVKVTILDNGSAEFEFIQ
ncbi:prepilin-type N-terminal cleavage/methylation domain-containing protein [Virgibacillus kekensis]|uniref:Prepilin-type N-terminal cleavage/methylation domain-containing protein n=1 Tax=Virgibacillus kekensis TaxID=202261 RepID=A0ABV9DD15_9BACI